MVASGNQMGLNNLKYCGQSQTKTIFILNADTNIFCKSSVTQIISWEKERRWEGENLEMT